MRPKVLITRFSSIGDIVLTTPVVRCLKLQLDAEVHYLTKQSYATLLHPNPYIHQVHTIQSKIKEVVSSLHAEKFDYIIDLHNNIRSQQVKWALKARAYTFDKINWQKWLMVNLKINQLPSSHIVDRYLATTTSLGIQNDGKGLDYFIPEKDQIEVSNFLSHQTPYIAFAIGAAHATKRLPLKKIVEICRQIKQPIILLGGPAEKQIGEALAVTVGKNVINTCGALNLHQSASIVQQAWKVITHDTGMMHIAAAFQKPIISIWGNTIPEFGMSPYYAKGMERNISIELKNLDCRPCSKIGHSKCPKGHFNCMNQIDATAVATALQQ